MATNKANVSTAKPKIGGAMYMAPIGTALPTSASSALGAAYKCLGYLSEEGFANNNSPDVTETKAFGGDIVISDTERNDTFTTRLIETLNVDVKKLVYGDANVTVNDDGSLAVTANTNELEDRIIIFDVILKGGKAQRTVIPSGKVTSLAEINYRKDQPIGYEVTITASADGSGNTHYEYTTGSSSEIAIKSFKIGNAYGSIDNNRRIIDVVVPHGTALTSLSPVIAVTDGATVSPASGTSGNFSNPVIYTVTKTGAPAVQYIVNVTAAEA